MLGSLACLCSASSQGRGPLGALGGTHLAQGLMGWRRVHSGVCLAGLQGRALLKDAPRCQCWGALPAAVKGLYSLYTNFLLPLPHVNRNASPWNSPSFQTLTCASGKLDLFPNDPPFVMYVVKLGDVMMEGRKLALRCVPNVNNASEHYWVRLPQNCQSLNSFTFIP